MNFNFDQLSAATWPMGGCRSAGIGQCCRAVTAAVKAASTDTSSLIGID